MFSWKTSECISNKLKYYKQFSQIQPGNPNSTWLFNHSCSAGHRNFYQSYEAVRATSGKSLYLSCERNSALPPFLNKNTSLAALAQQRHLITSFCWSTKIYKPPIERKGKEALLLITKQIQYTLYSLLSTRSKPVGFHRHQLLSHLVVLFTQQSCNKNNSCDFCVMTVMTQVLTLRTSVRVSGDCLCQKMRQRNSEFWNINNGNSKWFQLQSSLANNIWLYLHRVDRCRVCSMHLFFVTWAYLSQNTGSTAKLDTETG